MAPRDELDELLDVLLTFAQEQLAKHDALLPFGASLSAGGEVALAAAQPETDDATAADLAELLLAGLRGRAAAGEIRAAAVCTDVRIDHPEHGPTDALRVVLEHTDGDAADVYLPYEQHGPSERDYGELVALARERTIFVT
jgi:hypothetical protein